MPHDEIQHPICAKQVIRMDHGSFSVVIHYAEALTADAFEFRHMHPYGEIFYVIEGQLSVMVGDEVIVMKEGNLLFVAENTPHHVLLKPGSVQKYFVFIFEVFPRWAKINSKFFPGNFDAAFFLKQVQIELQEKSFGSGAAVSLLLNLFAIRALRILNLETDKFKDSGEKRNIAIEITDFMQEHYAENISFKDLSEHFHISTRQLKRIFSKMYNGTFSETLKILRLAHAKHMIEDSGHSLEQIAQGVGIGSEQSLRKLFRKYEGITISYYKKRCAEAEPPAPSEKNGPSD